MFIRSFAALESGPLVPASLYINSNKFEFKPKLSIAFGVNAPPISSDACKMLGCTAFLLYKKFLASASNLEISSGFVAVPSRTSSPIPILKSCCASGLDISDLAAAIKEFASSSKTFDMCCLKEKSISVTNSGSLYALSVNLETTSFSASSSANPGNPSAVFISILTSNFAFLIAILSNDSMCSISLTIAFLAPVGSATTSIMVSAEVISIIFAPTDKDLAPVGV